MPVEFLGTAATDDGSETTARSGAAFAKEYTLRFAHHRDLGVVTLSARGHDLPGEEFTPPHGGLLLLPVEHGAPVAGGAFRRHDAATAELKRVRTHSAHRGRGLARRVSAEPERGAGARGHRRIHLTTGPRRPEARCLYPATGSTPLSGTRAAPETIGPLPFEKHLAPVPQGPGAAADR